MKAKLTWKQAIGVFAWAIVSMVLSSLVRAYALRALWRWFMEAGYGAGPTIGQWFGIGAMLGLIAGMATRGVARETEAEGTPIRSAMRRVIDRDATLWIGVGIALAFYWALGSIAGWVQ